MVLQIKLSIKILRTLVILSAFGVLFISCKEDKDSPGSSQNENIQLAAFSAQRAFADIEKQVKFGPRVPGSKAHEECKDWLVETLSSAGGQVVVQNFKSNVFDKTAVESYNIIASFNPENIERILLAAHWDTRAIADKDTNVSKQKSPIDGADDGASGVGVLLEVARWIQASKPEIGVDIILFDAEDQGIEDAGWCQGSNYWSNFPHKPGYRANYGILLDMVGAKDAMFGYEGYSRANAKNIQDKVWMIAHELGYQDLFTTTNTGPVQDDHYYIMLNRKIPTIDIINRPLRTISGFGSYHHTHDDNLSVIDTNTLYKVGNVVINVIQREKGNQSQNPG